MEKLDIRYEIVKSLLIASKHLQVVKVATMVGKGEGQSKFQGIY
jgi:hypothetical protein